MISTLARVARVIDAYTVVLNKGSADGVELNDKFIIFGIGDDVIDPDSGSNLGSLEIVRGRAKVEHLQDRVCTVRTMQTYKIPGKKRTIERKAGATVWLMSGGPSREEIEEDHTFADRELEGSIVGDYARPF